jgi:hypothetical protein
MARNAFTIIDDLKQGLAELAAALTPLAALAGGARRPRAKRVASVGVKRNPRSRGQAAAKKPVVRRNRKPVSAKVRAQRVMQGRYLGAVRPLSKENRAKVKQVQAAKGYPAAIALAKKLKK